MAAVGQKQENSLKNIRPTDGTKSKIQRDHRVNLGDSLTSSTQIRFSVHTGRK